MRRFIGMQEMTEPKRSGGEVNLAFAVIRRGEANRSIQESLQACLQGSYCMRRFIGMQEMTEPKRSAVIHSDIRCNCTGFRNKKPSPPIDYYTEYLVQYIPTSGATEPVFGMEGVLWKLNVMFIWIS